MINDILAQLTAAEALLAEPVPDDLATLSRAIGTLRRFGEAENLPTDQRERAVALANALAQRALEDVRRRYRNVVPKPNNATSPSSDRRFNER